MSNEAFFFLGIRVYTYVKNKKVELTPRNLFSLHCPCHKNINNNNNK